MLLSSCIQHASMFACGHMLQGWSWQMPLQKVQCFSQTLEDFLVSMLPIGTYYITILPMSERFVHKGWIWWQKREMENSRSEVWYLCYLWTDSMNMKDLAWGVTTRTSDRLGFSPPMWPVMFLDLPVSLKVHNTPRNQPEAMGSRTLSEFTEIRFFNLLHAQTTSVLSVGQGI